MRFARIIPVEVVEEAGSGHAGTAVSLTPLLYALFQRHLRHNPHEPEWMGRDRFVLSCGHASLALYLQLYLSGYGLEIDDLRAFRVRGSRTPGHPERDVTPGVEVSTGPLGQGVANAVGIALSGARVADMLGTELFSPHVWCLASDGDLEEGVSGEAASLAGALGLSGLTLIWDDNRISIEGPTGITFREDVGARFRAYGWDVLTIDDAEDLDAISAALDAARAVTDRPVLIRLRTVIGYPIPGLAGTHNAHAGAVGPERLAALKEHLGADPKARYEMPVLDHAREVAERGRTLQAEWEAAVARWREERPEQAQLLDRLRDGVAPDGLDGALDGVAAVARTAATRQASGAVLAAVGPVMPELWGGSADLAESNNAVVAADLSFLPRGGESAEWPGRYGGRQLHFGIREHAMAGILNGIALHGLTRVFGATYLVFADYLRPAVRLAALQQLPVIHVWTHDSISVGEDGPTHQPVEQLWSLRAIPGLAVARPADWVETVEVWRRVLTRRSGPTALALSRHATPVLDRSSSWGSPDRGGYVVRAADNPQAILYGTGTEVGVCEAAADLLAGKGIRCEVVSLPCLEWLAEESAEYRDRVLHRPAPARFVLEAGISLGWAGVLGSDVRCVSVEEFGTSGSGSEALAAAGFTPEAVAAAVTERLEAPAGERPPAVPGGAR
ncbi:MAG: transketolase [Actinomycetes bacterium]|nr:transketolase [Actinomycetes bacterium]